MLSTDCIIDAQVCYQFESASIIYFKISNRLFEFNALSKILQNNTASALDSIKI